MKKVCSTNGPRTTRHACIWKRLNLDPFLILYTKINSKWILELNVRVNTIKLLEENTNLSLHDLELGNYFLNITPKTTSVKRKKIKRDFIKIKLLYFKYNINKVKRQLTYWKKIFASHI